MKKDLLAAERYAQALFELSHAENQSEYAEAALESFAAVLAADSSIEKFLANPALSTVQKKSVLQRVFSGKPDEHNYGASTNRRIPQCADKFHMRGLL